MRWIAGWWAILVIALALAGAAPAHAQGGFDAGEPIGIKMWVYVGAKPQGAVPADKWVVEVKDKPVKFQVMKLEVLTGNTFYMNIFDKLDPYPIALNLVGEGQEKILNSPPGQQLVIIGNLQFGGGARLLYLSSVNTVEGTPKAQ